MIILVNIVGSYICNSTSFVLAAITSVVSVNLLRSSLIRKGEYQELP
jgi:hypothetical protein